MQNLIGVYHVESNLERLISYVSEQHGVPKSLMLELPPYWREIKNGYIARDNNYFFKLAETFEEKGTEIIPGDTCMDLAVPRELYDKLDYMYDKKATSFREKLDSLWLVIKGNLAIQRYLFSPKREKLRDEGFLRAFDEGRPELTIVGDFHAEYIKRIHPEVRYTRFRSNTFCEKLTWASRFLELRRRVRPEREIIVRS
ncbi:MAG: hypothetical protein PHH00_04285 [Candidatus Nanoarchaeia archaeon]|nr:hypothetical protein [Candidatus Nanoarchaeia archaeon]